MLRSVVVPDRIFAPSERQFLGDYPMTVMPAVLIEGPLDISALARAWDHLLARHPVLAGKAQRRGDEYWLVLDGRPASMGVHQRPNPELYLAQAEPLNPEQALGALEVIQEGSRSTVLLKAHHSIADAHAAFSWFFQLWADYTQCAYGKDLLTPTPVGVPMSIETHLSRRGIHAAKDGCLAIDLAALKETASIGREPAVGSVWHKSFELGPNTVAALKAQAKNAGTTIHGALTGAVLVAERTLLDRSTAAVPMALVSPVDVRSAVTPQIPLHAVTNGIGYAYTRVPVSPGSNPLSVGRDVREILRNYLANGEAVRSALHVEHWVTASKQLGPFSMVTNFGSYPPLLFPTDLRNIGVALARHDYTETPPHPLYVAHTLNGRLTVGLHYHGERFGRGTLDQLVELVEQNLRGCAKIQ